KVLLEVAADNPRAVEIYTRAGFQTEGVLRRQLARPDGFVDVIVMPLFLASCSSPSISRVTCPVAPTSRSPTRRAHSRSTTTSNQARTLAAASSPALRHL